MFFIIWVIIIWLISCAFVGRKLNKQGRIKISIILAFMFSIVITVDLGYNYLSSTIISMNDGITIRGLFAYFLFNDRNWSIENFFKAFKISADISVGLFCIKSITNIINTYLNHKK